MQIGMHHVLRGTAIEVRELTRPLPHHLTGHCVDACGFPRVAFPGQVCFHGSIISGREEKFVRYAMSSSGARRDLRACRGIWKKCCPAFETLELEPPLWVLVQDGGGSLKKSGDERLSRSVR